MTHLLFHGLVRMQPRRSFMNTVVEKHANEWVKMVCLVKLWKMDCSTSKLACLRATGSMQKKQTWGFPIAWRSIVKLLLPLHKCVSLFNWNLLCCNLKPMRSSPTLWGQQQILHQVFWSSFKQTVIKEENYSPSLALLQLFLLTSFDPCLYLAQKNCHPMEKNTAHQQLWQVARCLTTAHFCSLRQAENRWATHWQESVTSLCQPDLNYILTAFLAKCHVPNYSGISFFFYQIRNLSLRRSSNSVSRVFFSKHKF